MFLDFVDIDLFLNTKCKISPKFQCRTQVKNKNANQAYDNNLTYCKSKQNTLK